MSSIWQRLGDIAVFDELYRRTVTEFVPNLLAAALTFAALYVVARLFRRAFASVALRAKLDATLVNFVQQSVRFALFAVALIAALGQLGVNTASLLTSLGVAGLTLGFAARDALSNVIAGVFIFWDRPFSIGDLIEVSGRYGKVQEITMRSTRVVTPDGKMLAIPNTEIVNSTVASYTNFPHLRVEIDITVGVGEDLEAVRRVLVGLVEGDARFMSQPEPELVVTSLGDYNVAIQFRAWIDDERTHIPIRFELRRRAFEALRDAGVDMPFETLEIRPLRLLSA